MMSGNIIGANKRCNGFTLIELGLALILISVMVGISLQFGLSALADARLSQTRSKLDVLEDALKAFQRANNRLPCPSDVTLAADAAAYGQEASSPGVCTGGSPAAPRSDAATYAVEGGIPFLALGLTEEFSHDGWGRRMAYAVDRRYTGNEAFTSLDVYDQCGSITLRDAAGSDRAQNAIYALLSYGPNGHGARDKLNTLVNASSAQVDELANCKCDASAVYSGTYTPLYVQRELAGSGTNQFDDLVRFKTRANMPIDQDDTHSPYVGNEFLLGTAVTGYTQFYDKSCDTYTATASPVMTDVINTASVAYNGIYWFLGGQGTPYLSALKWDKATHVYNDVTAGFGINFTLSAPVNAIATSAFNPRMPDSFYLAVGHENSGGNYLTMYKIDQRSDSLTILNGANGPQSQHGSAVLAVDISPQAAYVATGHGSSPYLMVYKRTDDVFDTAGATLVAQPEGAVHGVAFSPDGKYMATANEDASDPRVYLTLYGINSISGVFTRLTSPADLPTCSGLSVSFSSDSRYLAFACAGGTQSLYVYRVDTAANPVLALVTGVNSSYGDLTTAVFSPREHELLLGSNSVPYLSVVRYIPIEGSFSLQDSGFIASQPGGGVRAIAVRGRYKE